jgi:hypothetical protein
MDDVKAKGFKTRLPLAEHSVSEAPRASSAEPASPGPTGSQRGCLKACLAVPSAMGSRI